VVIGGTSYAGEIKKSVFTILNGLLPLRNVLSMHCSANHGQDTDDVALFFGLSGTGKTTLSTSPDRFLIGDDEHGWSDTGVFNFEGGSYAKVIGLSVESEPEIYETRRKFGTVLENFVSGYTSEVAGTEKGVTDPQATFSPCFGGPFLPLHPRVYTQLLGDMIRKHEARCWLLNTGITGGPYGEGHRIAIKITRSLIAAAVGGTLDDVLTRADPVFQLSALESCPRIAENVLNPRASWFDRAGYDAKAKELAERFETNHKQLA